MYDVRYNSNMSYCMIQLTHMYGYRLVVLCTLKHALSMLSLKAG